MERLTLKLQDTLKALQTLEDVLVAPPATIQRDASIQRFKYTFEAFWKFIKEYLKELEGTISNTPKACFKELFSLGLISEDQSLTCLSMTDRRNETSHAYKEMVAIMIYKNLPEYLTLMKTIVDTLQKKLA